MSKQLDTLPETTSAPDSLIRRLADSDNPNSFANRMRSRRFQLFEAAIASCPRPVHILDVGGTNEYWERRGWAGRDDIQIVTLNIKADEQLHDNIQSLAGDATDLSTFGDRSFDVVFSNSVIEHLFTIQNQARMAAEIQRVAKAFWVQTPNFWFPMEPHFHVPGWQWMPVGMRVAILQRRQCGWRGPAANSAEAREFVREVRLLTKGELKQMFPGATLLAERFAGLVKSWTVIGGFPKGSQLGLK
jgi:hypothetical protein